MSVTQRPQRQADEFGSVPSAPDSATRPDRRYERQRTRSVRLNNSPRRTYDLLRSSLVGARRNALLVENELAEALSASRNTVRSALQQLAREGLVIRAQRTGTRTAGSVTVPINELIPVGQLADSPLRGHRTTVRTLDSRSVGRPPLVCEKLRLPDDWAVYMVEYLVLDDDVALGLAVSYLALDPCEAASFEVVDPDVIVLLERQLGVRIGDSRTTLGAIGADAQTAGLLGLEPGAPLVWLEDLIEDCDGQPRALSQLRLRGDRVALSAEARRPV